MKIKLTTKERQRGGVGMPASLYLQEFGQLIEDVFGDCPYQVGSSLASKTDFRDVDVRVILSDEDYEKWGFGNPEHPQQNKKWRSLVKAYSILGQIMTGLPIDFQIQQQTNANRLFKGSRSALFDLTRLV